MVYSRRRLVFSYKLFSNNCTSIVNSYSSGTESHLTHVHLTNNIHFYTNLWFADPPVLFLVALLATQLPERWWSGFADIIPMLRSRFSRERLHHVDFDYVDDPDYLYGSGSEARIKKRRRAHGRRGRRPAIAGRRSSFDVVEDSEEGEPMGLLDTIAAHLLTKRSTTLDRSAGPKEFVRKKPTGHNRPRVGATNLKK